MYKERREKISIKFYILIALVILIIVFAIILLTPHKKKVTTKKESVKMELYSKSSLAELKKEYSDVFYNNFIDLKDTFEKYFQKKVETFSDKETVLLSKLYDNHIIATLEDKDGNQCDSEQTKIVLTQNSNNKNYKVVITLICGEEKASLTTYMGAYDYCKNETYCEKKIEAKEKVKEEEKPKEDEEIIPSEIIPEMPQESTNVDIIKDYPLYEYVLTPSDNNGKWTDWSDWSLEIMTPTLYKEIDTKSETKTSEYDCSTSTTQSYITGYKEEKYIAGYTTTITKVGTKKEGGNVVAVYDTKTVPVYGTRKVPIYATRTIQNQKTCTKEDVTNYYRYRTFTYKKGINYVRYSSSDNDQALVTKGYTKTGNTK